MNLGQRKLAGSKNIMSVRLTGAETTSSHVEIKIILVRIQMDYHFC